jgi:hypothetical protein
MSVPALIDELATSSLITGLAKGMTQPNRQSSRVRVTNSRDARGAVGCAATCFRSTASGGVVRTSDTAENNDAVRIR